MVPNEEIVSKTLNPPQNLVSFYDAPKSLVLLFNFPEVCRFHCENQFSISLYIILVFNH